MVFSTLVFADVSRVNSKHITIGQSVITTDCYNTAFGPSLQFSSVHNYTSKTFSVELNRMDFTFEQEHYGLFNLRLGAN